MIGVSEIESEVLGVKVATRDRRDAKVRWAAQGWVWVCPFCDYSSQEQYPICRSCGAQLEGITVEEPMEKASGTVVKSVESSLTLPPGIARVVLDIDKAARDRDKAALKRAEAALERAEAATKAAN